MKKVLVLLAVVVFASAGVAQAETWRGVVGDSMCGAKHSEAKGTDHSKCVLKCIQDGSTYVLVTKDSVFKIANQSFADLKTHAGHVVMLSGEMKGDTITVAKIEPVKPEKEKK